ncbi:fibronectin type III domain-containing protein [Candidatus Desantisbacteria bacterium]|nr:fibronectin type III domain-containing protein [Candidatus Desantisbacteria bacterium]
MSKITSKNRAGQYWVMPGYSTEINKLTKVKLDISNLNSLPYSCIKQVVVSFPEANYVKRFSVEIPSNRSSSVELEFRCPPTTGSFVPVIYVIERTGYGTYAVVSTGLNIVGTQSRKFELSLKLIEGNEAGAKGKLQIDYSWDKDNPAGLKELRVNLSAGFLPASTVIPVILPQGELVLPVYLPETPGDYSAEVVFTDTGGGSVSGTASLIVAGKGTRNYGLTSGFVLSNEKKAMSRIRVEIKNNETVNWHTLGEIELKLSGIVFNVGVGADCGIGYRVISSGTNTIKLAGVSILPGNKAELIIPVINPAQIGQYAINVIVTESSSRLSFALLPVNLQVGEIGSRNYTAQIKFAEGYSQEQWAKSRLELVVKNNNSGVSNEITNIYLSGYKFSHRLMDDIGGGFKVLRVGEDWVLIEGKIAGNSQATMTLTCINPNNIGTYKIMGTVTESIGLQFGLPAMSVETKVIGVRSAGISADLIGNNESGALGKIAVKIENNTQAAYQAIKTIQLKLPDFEVITGISTNLGDNWQVSNKGEDWVEITHLTGKTGSSSVMLEVKNPGQPGTYSLSANICELTELTYTPQVLAQFKLVSLKERQYATAIGISGGYSCENGAKTRINVQVGNNINNPTNIKYLRVRYIGLNGLGSGGQAVSFNPVESYIQLIPECPVGNTASVVLEATNPSIAGDYRLELGVIDSLMIEKSYPGTISITDQIANRYHTLEIVNSSSNESGAMNEIKLRIKNEQGSPEYSLIRRVKIKIPGARFSGASLLPANWSVEKIESGDTIYLSTAKDYLSRGKAIEVVLVLKNPATTVAASIVPEVCYQEYSGLEFLPTIIGRLELIRQISRKVNMSLGFMSGFSPEAGVNSKVYTNFNYMAGPADSSIMKVYINLSEIGFGTPIKPDTHLTGDWFVKNITNGILEIENRGLGIGVGSGFNLDLDVQNPRIAGGYLPTVWLIDNIGVVIPLLDTTGRWEVMEQENRKISGDIEYETGYSHEAGAVSQIILNISNGNNPSYCQLSTITVGLSAGEILSEPGESVGAGWLISSRLSSGTVTLSPSTGAMIRPNESRVVKLRIRNPRNPSQVSVNGVAMEVSGREINIPIVSTAFVIPQKPRYLSISPRFKTGYSSEIKAISVLELEVGNGLDSPEYSIVTGLRLSCGSLISLPQTDIGGGWYLEKAGEQVILKARVLEEGIKRGQSRKFLLNIQNPTLAEVIMITGTATESIGLSYKAMVIGALNITRNIPRQWKASIGLECIVGGQGELQLVVANPKLNPLYAMIDKLIVDYTGFEFLSSTGPTALAGNNWYLSAKEPNLELLPSMSDYWIEPGKQATFTITGGRAGKYAGRYKFNVFVREVSGEQATATVEGWAIINDPTPPSDIAYLYEGLGTDTDIGTQNTVWLSWAASQDMESGIKEYLYKEDGTTTWQSAGNGTRVLISDLEDGKWYKFSVCARNGWEMIGSRTDSDGIFIDTSPPGTPTTADMGEYTATSTLRFSWQAEDIHSGIGTYSVSIYEDNKLVKFVEYSSATTSMQYIGIDGKQYVCKVKAINGVGLSSGTGSSDGIVVDSTPPAAQIRLLPFIENGEIKIFGTAADRFFDSYRVLVGNDIIATGTNSVSNGTLAIWNSISVSDGSWTIRLEVQDTAGLISTDSVFILIDNSPPTGTPTIPVTNSRYSTSTAINFNWDRGSLADIGSGISGYELWIGTTGITVGSRTTYLFIGRQGETYSSRVRGINGALLKSEYSHESSPVTVDITPPDTVRVMDQGSYTTNLELEFWFGSSTDAESGILWYEYELGTKSLGTRSNSGSITITVDSLGSYSLRVRAVNGALLCSNWRYSDGIIVDNTAPVLLEVRDGKGTDTDMTASGNTLRANWSGFDLESDIVGCWYAIGTTEGGTDTIDWTSLSPTAASAAVSDLILQDGVTYYFSIKLRNGVGLEAADSSDGIVVAVAQPPVPEIIRDGADADIDYSANTSSYSCNFDLLSTHEYDITGYDVGLGTNTTTTMTGFKRVGTSTKLVCFTNLSLEQRTRYYSLVRSVNRHNKVSEILASDGFMVDVTPPGVTILSPANGYISGTKTIMVRGNIREDYGTPSIKVNGQSAVVTGDEFTATITITQDGTNTMWLTATDAAGNVGTAAGEVILDRMAPRITILSPVSGYISCTETIMVRGSVREDYGTPSILINGQSAVIMGDEFMATVTLTQEGTNTVWLTATDAAGNVGTAAGEVILDRTAPGITILSPVSGHISGTETIMVRGSGREDYGIPSILINGQSAVVTGDEFMATVTLTQEGINTVWLTTTDTVGNVGTAAGEVILDRTAPMVTIISPVNGYISGTKTVVVRGNGREDYGTPSILINGQLAIVTGDEFMATVTLTQEGTNTVQLTAMDTVGNVGTAAGEVILDKTAPMVTILSPVSGHISGTETIMVRGSVREAYGTPSILINGQSAIVTGDEFMATVTITQEGTNTVQLTAMDTAGNVGTVASEVILDTTAPMIMILSPVNGYISGRKTIMGLGSVMENYGTPSISVNGQSAIVTGDEFMATITLTQEGTNTVWLTTMDTVGNVGTAAGEVILDSTPPIPGTVSDGFGEDIGTTSSNSWLAGNFSQWQDDESGIIEYEYSIGSQPELADIFPWQKIATKTYALATGLQLIGGKTYYFNVKGINQAQLYSIAASDGVTVLDIDLKPPAQVNDGLDEDIDYLGTTTIISGNWSKVDLQGRKFDYYYAMREGFGNFIIPWTCAGTKTQFVSRTTLQQGKQYYLFVKVVDENNFSSEVAISDGIIVDITPPEPVVIIDGDYIATKTISISWTPAREQESIFKEYYWRVSPVEEGFRPPANWISAGTATSINFTASSDGRYYFEVKAVNTAGLFSISKSDGIIIDTSPPLGTPTPPMPESTYSSIPEISFNWTGGNLTDIESGLIGYEIELNDGRIFNLSTNTLECSGTQNYTYQAKVRAINGAGLSGQWSDWGNAVTINMDPPRSKIITTIDKYWQTQPLTITVTGENSVGLKQISLYYSYSKDNEIYTAFNLYGKISGTRTTFTYPYKDGYYRFISQAEDMAGNKEPFKSSYELETGYDITPPDSYVLPVIPYYQQGSFNLTYKATDNSSGASLVQLYYNYSEDGKNWTGYMCYGTITTFIPEKEGYYQFYTRATDIAGNLEPAPQGYDTGVLVKTQRPESQIFPLDTYWYNQPINIQVMGSDTIGLKGIGIYYRQEGNTAWQRYIQQEVSGTRVITCFNLDIKDNGYYEFSSRAEDITGRTEDITPKITLGVDTIPPEIQELSVPRILKGGETATITWKISDNLQSGTISIFYPTATTKVIILETAVSMGSYTWRTPEDISTSAFRLIAQACDKAGNYTEKTISFILDTTPPVLNRAWEEGGCGIEGIDTDVDIDGDFVVRWDEGIDPESKILYYEVYESQDEEGFNLLGTTTTTIYPINHTDKRNYRYKIIVVNELGLSTEVFTDGIRIVDKMERINPSEVKITQVDERGRKIIITLPENAFGTSTVIMIIRALKETQNSKKFSPEAGKKDLVILNCSLREIIALNDKNVAVQPEKEIEIVIPYDDPDELDEITDTFYRIYRLDENGWNLSIGKQRVNSLENNIQLTTNHLSIFGILASSNLRRDRVIEGDVYPYPNPYKPSIHPQMKWWGIPEAGRLKIWTISGELIYDTVVSSDANNEYEFKEADQLPSGIYIYVVIDRYGGFVRGKFGVIR